MGAMPVPRSTARTMVALGGLAGLGYIGWRHVWIPYKAKKAGEDEMRLALLQNPALAQRPDQLAQAGSVACQGVAAYYGIPPQATGQMCQQVGAAAAGVLREAPALIRGFGGAAGSAVGDIGVGLGRGIGGIGTGIGAGTSGVLRGVASGTQATIDVPLNTVGKIYGGGKTVVKDIYSGAETVVEDVTGAIGSTASAVKKGLGKLKFW